MQFFSIFPVLMDIDIQNPKELYDTIIFLQLAYC